MLNCGVLDRKKGLEMFNATKCFIRGQQLSRKKIPLIPTVYRFILRCFCGCEIQYSVKVGDDFFLEHNGLGVVIHPNVIIGDNVTVYQNVTIGKKSPQYSGGGSLL